MKNNLQVHLSEEDYTPMPLTMKRMLVDGRRYKHVVPSRHPVVQAGEGEKKSDREDIRGERVEEYKPVINIEPVVTVLNVHSESRGRQRPAEQKESQMKQEIPSSQIPIKNNIKCSKTDLQTGLGKSLFTLQLEERLRQSKLELGFDTDLEDWKEFSYRTVKPEGRRGTESVEKQKVFSRQESAVDGLKVEPVQYCTHNCQILGLCGVKKPDLFQSFEPSIFNDEINWKYNIKHLLKDEVRHHKREECNCDFCTLAYLTDMGFPEHEDRRAVVSIKKTRKPSRNSSFNITGDGDTPLEIIKITDTGNLCKSIEVSVPDRQSSPESVRRTGNTSRSVLSTETVQEDCTNLKIKKMFEKNMIGPKMPTRTYFYGDGANTTYNDVSIVNLSTSEPEHETADGASHSSRTPSNHRTADRRRSCVTKRRSTFNSAGKQSSSSTLDASASSSLSTVLSYQRVRQIFLTFIEKNRSRRRSRKNVHKFREMEELGLGQLKKNRWYPSDSKTFSIWNDMHSNVRGFQAQFKKYPKIVSKP